MQPGLRRAVPMGILGFLLGAVTVVIGRGLVGVEPIWNGEIAVILGAFTSAAAFVWGMGSFGALRNWRRHEPDRSDAGTVAEGPEGQPEDGTRWLTVLGYSLVQVICATVVLLVAVGLLVFATDLPVQITSKPAASSSDVGYKTVTLPLLGDEVVVSQFTLLIGFGLLTLVMVAVVAGIVGLGVVRLDRAINAAKTTPPPEVPYPPWPMRKFGQLAGWLARKLRGLPALLGNK